MNSTSVRCVHLYVCVIFFVSFLAVSSGTYNRLYQTSEEPSTLRLSRQIPYTSWTDDADVHHANKRLPIFLRTGRSRSVIEDGYTDLGKNNMQKGMWFGPRLGRTQRRDPTFEDDSLAYVFFPGNPVARQVHYTPRLGRESEEVVEREQEVEQGRQA